MNVAQRILCKEMKARMTKATEWKTLAMIGLCYAAWFGSGFLWLTSFWIVGLVLMPVAAAFHTSLQHEVIHGHPTRSAWLNELLVSLPLGAIFPYRRYRELHLKHHNDLDLTDPYEDPESYFWPLRRYTTMRPFMRWVFLINNTLVGRIVIGPVLTLYGFSRTEFWRLRAGEKGVGMAWALQGIGLVVLILIISRWFQMPLWVYGLIVVYPALSITSLRSYAEHQAAENVGARSAIVETHPVMALLYLNNNLHIVHHANPKVAWYDLPTLYQERREQFLAANENTLFHGYGDIARRFAFRVKQPVDHPFLHRNEVAPD
jgi:fatty acid desaturase